MSYRRSKIALPSVLTVSFRFWKRLSMPVKQKLWN